MNPEELRDIRRHLEMTQAELGQALGLSRVYVGLMERGKAEISERTTLALRAMRRPLRQMVNSYEPIRRLLEKGLIEADIEYKADFSINGRSYDYFLPSLNIFLELNEYGDAEKVKYPVEVNNIISLYGKGSVVLFTMLLKKQAIPREINVDRELYRNP